MVTRSWESAVDIMAAMAPEIMMPASQPGRRVVARMGMRRSGSSKAPLPKVARPTTPMRKAPQKAGTAHQAAISDPVRMSRARRMAM